MKNRGKKIALMAAGAVIASVLAGPAVSAAAEILAERSMHTVYVDGARVELDAYVIDGNNYVKLRDVGALVGFEVYWDGAAVQIDSDAPYTGEAPVPVDYSAAANPEIFTELYTREAYNAAYEALLGVRTGDYSRTGIVHFADPSDRQLFENTLADIANGMTLSLRGIDMVSTCEVYAHDIDRAGIDAATEGLIRQALQLPTDRDRVAYLNNWLCERVIYDSKAVASVSEIVLSPEPVQGRCGSFAYAMTYLCGRLGIPCISVHGEHHYWNLIYCDGIWSYTDVSLNDQISSHDFMLFSPTARKQIGNPEGTRFLQELLVPGSTL